MLHEEWQRLRAAAAAPDKDTEPNLPAVKSFSVGTVISVLLSDKYALDNLPPGYKDNCKGDDNKYLMEYLDNIDPLPIDDYPAGRISLHSSVGTNQRFGAKIYAEDIIKLMYTKSPPTFLRQLL
mmetsp:Transcript_35999/g.53677  ORF Transcript_35999/g.53677 Transcript_35999/m.53677 type:complete len:124 (-) Transcript_35999:118-489(-)